MIRYVSEETPEVGQWVSHCCDLDLFQLQTQEDIESVIKDADQGLDRTIYDNLKEYYGTDVRGDS